MKNYNRSERSENSEQGALLWVKRLVLLLSCWLSVVLGEVVNDFTVVENFSFATFVARAVKS